jgi:uncharacterized protein (TIGR02145 family)
LGTWVTGSPVAVSGKKFGGALYLPAAGYRGSDGAGTLNFRGSNGYYWSTRKNSYFAYYLSFSNNDAYANLDSSRGHGFSVRCIAE